MAKSELEKLIVSQAEVFEVTDLPTLDVAATTDAVDKRRLNEQRARQTPGVTELDIWRAKVKGQSKVSKEA